MKTKCQGNLSQFLSVTTNLTFCQAQYIIQMATSFCYYSNVIRAKSTDIPVQLIFFLRQGDELETFFHIRQFYDHDLTFYSKKLTLNHIYNTSIIYVLLYIQLSSPGPSASHQIRHIQLSSPGPSDSYQIQHMHLWSPGPSDSYQIKSTLHEKVLRISLKS